MSEPTKLAQPAPLAGAAGSVVNPPTALSNSMARVVWDEMRRRDATFGEICTVCATLMAAIADNAGCSDQCVSKYVLKVIRGGRRRIKRRRMKSPNDPGLRPEVAALEFRLWPYRDRLPPVRST